MNNDTRKDAVLVDIDAVLCDVGYEVTPEGFKWADFVKADLKRTPLMAGILLVRMLVEKGFYPVFLTARPEFMREQTEYMLGHYGFHSLCYMAANETAVDGDTDYQMKQAIEKKRVIVENNLMERFNFAYAIDDQEYNVELFKSLGIPSLQPKFLL